MRKFFTIALAFAGFWVLLVACSAPPGSREYSAGVREYKQGQYVRAKALFEKSIEARPGSEENALAYNYLGLTAWNLGVRADAREAFENSRRLNPLLPDSAYNLGVVLAAEGDMAGAAGAFSECAMLDPSDTRALEYLGGQYAAHQQWPEARRALYAALDRSPQGARILTTIAGVELGAGSTDQAVLTLLKALEKNSKYAPALFDLAEIYRVNLTNEEQAAAYFEKFLKVASGKDPHVSHAREVLHGLNKEDASTAEPPPVVQAVESATAAADAESEATVSTPAAASAEDVLTQASRLADRGKNQLALDMCLQVAANARAANNIVLQERALRTATRLCFDQPRAHYELGRFLLAQKKADAALKSFKQAVILDHRFSPAQIGMAEAAVQTGELDAALSGLKQAVQSDPKSADALFALARLYDEQLGIPEKAARTYANFATNFSNDARASKARKRARELSPSIQFPEYMPAPAGVDTAEAVTARVVSAELVAPQPPARQIKYKKPERRDTRAAVQAFDRGNYYQQQNRWDEAINYYLRSLENDDLIAGTWYNLGSAYAVKRDFDLAKDAYLRALNIQPGMDSARYNLALLYREQNDPASAISLLKEVIKNNPKNAAAHYVLGYLYADNGSTIELAKQHYKEFLRLSPQDPSARAIQQWLQAH